MKGRAWGMGNGVSSGSTRDCQGPYLWRAWDDFLVQGWMTGKVLEAEQRPGVWRARVAT